MTLTSLTMLLRKLMGIGSLFSAPNKRQVAALVWRRNEADALEILMITTRRSGRWSIPKGWLIAGLTAAEAAAQEAWEEAGVRGVVDETPLGEFTYRKEILQNGPKTTMTATVFALQFSQLMNDFPEAGQRKRAWHTREDAANMVREPELGTLIRHFGC